MLNQILPDFLLIFSILIVAVGFLSLIIKVLRFREEGKEKVRTKHNIYCEEVEIAFGKVSELFVQAQQENIELATKQEAWEKIRLLHPALLRKRGKEVIPASPFDVGVHDTQSISKWYGILLDERIRCKEEKEEMELSSS